MPRTRAFAVVVLLLSYGAVGARQPAVRTAAPLPVPARVLAQALEIPEPDRSRLVLDIVRLVFDAPDGFDEGDRARRRRLTQALQAATKTRGETVPLPLDPSIWRETILQRQAADPEIIAAVLSDRRLALLYHGLAALDDETLAWLGPDRETLQHLLRRPGAFAAFGRSLRVSSGRIIVPGGPDAEPLWESLVGGSVAKPGTFVRRLFANESGRLPFLYDTVAQLDAPHQRFALDLTRDAGGRSDRLRTLAELFESVATDWRVEERPFSRPQLDPSLTLTLVDVTPDGQLTGPASRELWELVFQGDAVPDRRFDVGPAGGTQAPPGTAIDAAWLLGRIHRVPLAVSRQRLETFLFAQRLLGNARDGQAAVAAALRAVGLFPTLMATLERSGVRSVPLMIAAAARAQSLNDIRDDGAQRVATTAFQAALGIIERMVRSGGLAATDAVATIASLVSLESSSRAYDERIGEWIRRELLPALPALTVDQEVDNPVEGAVLAAMAGVKAGPALDPVVAWEGRTYRVSAARAELLRLKGVRRQQGGASIDAALSQLVEVTRTHPRLPLHPVSTVGPTAAADAPDARDRPLEETTLADTLASVLYAAHLGDAQGGALLGGNVALRHDFGVARGPTRTTLAWRLPREEFGSIRGWRVSGSLLGLEAALGRVALKRLDAGEMPPEPRLTSNERQTMFLTAALLNAREMTDATRDEIAAALGRGRARLNALGADRTQIERVARDAGLSAGRRESLAWTIEHERDRLFEQFSLAEIMWLGAPRASASVSLDAWGAAQLPLTGCLCLRMPEPGNWELLSGRPSVGLLATRGVDVSLRVAEVLAELRLPAVLAAGTVAYAMQDVVDRAQPAYFGDWMAVNRAARELTRDRIVDYVAALTTGGPLLPNEDQND